MTTIRKRAAHFLLLPELAHSPPNDAIVAALKECDLDVDLFAPGPIEGLQAYGPTVSGMEAHYGWRWLARNAANLHWRRYSVFSSTAEDPIAVAGVISALHRRPLFVLVDEIKSGAYAGNRSGRWKALCQRAMRRARFNIVNDESRVPLLREYAKLPVGSEVVVYPGCFREPPAACDVAMQRRHWKLPAGAPVLGVSGGVNLTAGTQWVLQALMEAPDLYAVFQPTNLDAFARFLLSTSKAGERMYIEPARLGWREAWAAAAACDIGIAIYHNDAPQFQSMGASSNRLCMYLAMGVPVITSRQSSFRFVEEYDCGIMVDTFAEFVAAIDAVRSRLDAMKQNAIRCAAQYIDAPGRYIELARAIKALV